MKQIIHGTVFCVLLMFLGACSSETNLKCIIEDEKTLSFEVQGTNDKALKAVEYYEIEVPEKQSEEVSQMFLEEAYEKFEGIEGFEFSYRLENGTFFVTVNYDYTVMSLDDLQLFSNSATDIEYLSIEKTKTSLEKQGYVCEFN